MKLILGLLAGAAIAVGTATAASASDGGTEVPGHEGRDGTVTGVYEQDGVRVQYRGDFGGTPYLDNGWIKNQWRNEDGTVETYLIVHESDPRYTGHGEDVGWGPWEASVHTISGQGNVANPHRPAR